MFDSTASGDMRGLSDVRLTGTPTTLTWTKLRRSRMDLICSLGSNPSEEVRRTARICYDTSDMEVKVSFWLRISMYRLSASDVLDLYGLTMSREVVDRMIASNLISFAVTYGVSHIPEDQLLKFASEGGPEVVKAVLRNPEASERLPPKISESLRDRRLLRVDLDEDH